MTGPRGLRRRVAATAVAIAVILAAAYGGSSAFAYSLLAPVSAHCPANGGPLDIGDPIAFSASLTVDGVAHVVDTTPYLMPVPETASFPARDDAGITIAGWWEPASVAGAPAIIVVHGQNGCRRNSGNLLAAGMLHRHGFSVLLIDMRNHGDSTVEDGQFALGTDEYRDVLGAFDWLLTRGVPASRIGVFGFSGGAGTVLIAAGQEPRIAAVWADSAWADVRSALDDGLRDGGFPTIIDNGVLAIGTLLNGHGVEGLTPAGATTRIAGRPIALVHGALDRKVHPWNLDALSQAVRDAGGAVDTWLVPGAGHTQAHFLVSDEYEGRVAAFFERAFGWSATGA